MEELRYVLWMCRVLCNPIDISAGRFGVLWYFNLWSFTLLPMPSIGRSTVWYCIHRYVPPLLHISETIDSDKCCSQELHSIQELPIDPGLVLDPPESDKVLDVSISSQFSKQHRSWSIHRSNTQAHIKFVSAEGIMCHWRRTLLIAGLPSWIVGIFLWLRKLLDCLNQGQCWFLYADMIILGLCTKSRRATTLFLLANLLQMRRRRDLRRMTKHFPV